MKRDMELIRKILFAMEEQDSYRTKYPIEIEGYDQSTIFHHAWLMQNAGLIKCDPIGNPNTKTIEPKASPVCIDWAGYEFLEAARSQTIWNRAIHTVKATGVGMSFNVLYGLLKHYSNEKLGVDLD